MADKPETTIGPWRIAIWNRNRSAAKYCLKRRNPAWPWGQEVAAINGGPWTAETRQQAQRQADRLNGMVQA